QPLAARRGPRRRARWRRAERPGGRGFRERSAGAIGRAEPVRHAGSRRIEIEATLDGRGWAGAPRRARWACRMAAGLGRRQRAAERDLAAAPRGTAPDAYAGRLARRRGPTHSGGQDAGATGTGPRRGAAGGAARGRAAGIDRLDDAAAQAGAAARRARGVDALRDRVRSVHDRRRGGARRAPAERGGLSDRSLPAADRWFPLRRPRREDPELARGAGARRVAA